MKPFYFNPFDWSEDGNKNYLPSGEQFRALMSHCFLRSDFVTFSKYPWHEKKATMECELEPFLLRKFPVTRWFCYTLPQEQPLLILLYPASEDVKRILFCFYEDMFMSYPRREGEGTGEGKYCYALSDLCFFQGSRMFWGTVSHERMCMTVPPDRLFQDALPMADRWTSKPDADAEFVNLNEYL